MHVLTTLRNARHARRRPTLASHVRAFGSVQVWDAPPPLWGAAAAGGEAGHVHASYDRRPAAPDGLLEAA